VLAALDGTAPGPLGGKTGLLTSSIEDLMAPGPPARPAEVEPARRPGPARSGQGPLGSAGPAALALVGCGVCAIGGWRGTDWAAQVYRAGQAAHWGLVVWDPGWYGGTYPLNYSLVYPLAAGYLGLWLVALLSAAGAAYCFDRLVVRQFGKRPAGSWYFAASTVVEVAIGQLPTLAGEALALGSVLWLANYRRACVAVRRGETAPEHMNAPLPPLQVVGGMTLGVLAALTSPVVGSFLALALVAWGLADVGRVPRRVVAVELLAGLLVLASTAALPLIFPGPGYFPFGFSDLVVVLVICALLASPLLRAPRPVRAGALLYGAVSIGVFAFPNQMGDNDARLAAYIGVPLVICYLPGLIERLAGWRASGGAPTGTDGRLRQAAVFTGAGAVALFLVVWHWSPIVEAFDGAANGPSSTASYYQPLIGELHRLSLGDPVRVEIPPTVHHWESAYVAPDFPLARGWERQLDVAYNGLFYKTGPLSASAYRSWLLSNGVSFVAVAHAPLDYAATAEVALLRSGDVKGLQQVWQTATWEVWRVMGSPGLASGPARLLSLTPRSVVVHLGAPGRALLRVRWSPYWSLGPSSATQACVRRGPGGWTALNSARPGELELSLSVVHPDHGHCPPAGSVRSE
jgi:hypothetical protein